MQYDKFFDHVGERLFSGSMTQLQASGMRSIVARGQSENTSIRQLAYMLATAYHETAKAMQPVIETRQPGEKTNPSVETAIRRLDAAFAAGKLTWVSKPYWRKDADGKSWLGRGFVQLTHKENYRKLSGPCGIDLVKDPDAALTLGPAITIMFEGMIHGLFTGRPLSDYIYDKRADYRNARRVINGLESADKVAQYASTFEAALIAGGYVGLVAADPAVKPVVAEPIKPAAAVPTQPAKVAAEEPPAKRTAWAVLGDLLLKLMGGKA